MAARTAHAVRRSGRAVLVGEYIDSRAVGRELQPDRFMSQKEYSPHGPFAVLRYAALLLLVSPNCQAAAIERVSFADLSLEELANIRITSVSKRPERLADAAGSVFVITAEDIRRSGATSLPQVLRLAPNLQVAQTSANGFAISARGSNGSANSAPNKLLVLIDGRSAYSPLFSGVFWDVQDVVLADVERIEVISGPGGTLWGINAVNGVINVITKPAAQTQGTLAQAHVGNRDDGATVRYGGRAGHAERLSGRDLVVVPPRPQGRCVRRRSVDDRRRRGRGPVLQLPGARPDRRTGHRVRGPPRTADAPHRGVERPG